jgi:hypothetical protein
VAARVFSAYKLGTQSALEELQPFLLTPSIRAALNGLCVCEDIFKWLGVDPEKRKLVERFFPSEAPDISMTGFDFLSAAVRTELVAFSPPPGALAHLEIWLPLLGMKSRPPDSQLENWKKFITANPDHPDSLLKLTRKFRGDIFDTAKVTSLDLTDPDTERLFQVVYGIRGLTGARRNSLDNLRTMGDLARFVGSLSVDQEFVQELREHSSWMWRNRFRLEIIGRDIVLSEPHTDGSAVKKLRS